MNILRRAANLTRSASDPKVLKVGPSVRPTPDLVADGLGWFSLALGLAELFAAPSLARMLGTRGRENVIRAFGVRELAAGMTSLSVSRTAGLWSRFGGDILDIAALCAAYRRDNSKRQNLCFALAAVAAITLIDLTAAKRSAATHGRGNKPLRDYSNRSGFRTAPDTARGIARLAGVGNKIGAKDQ